MADARDPVTIVIPNWNTGALLRLCLASIHRHTRYPHRVVVVDNASDDASRETAERAAAAGLIELIRREDAQHDGAPEHGASLDAGLAVARTPLLFTLDSDAWARREGWLETWVNALGREASHAGASKFPGGRIKRLIQWLRREPPRPEATYVRPCHAIYRVELLRRYGLSFGPRQGEDGRWRTTGETIHEELCARGHRAVFIPHAEVERLVGHVRHATIVLNSGRFPSLRERARRRGERGIRELLAGPEAARILADTPIP
ncbi:MAG: glycosyltransferase family 2 protein [Planctomycetota bacterium]